MLKLTFAPLVLTLAIALNSWVDANPILSDEQVHAEFEKFKADFHRTYSSPSEELYRKQIFANNLERIHQHNAEAAQGQHTYTLGVNQFADLTREEFKARYLRPFYPNRVSKKMNQGNELPEIKLRTGPLPKSVDWTTKNAVTRIKDQGGCGSCYAFGTVGALEGQVAIKTGKLIELSEQQIVDCSGPEGNGGCNGGWMNTSYEYIRIQGGINSEAVYPYQATQQSCQFKNSSVAASVLGWYNLQEGSEEDLQAALATIGPVTVAVEATGFFDYQGGVISGDLCGGDINHSVTVVGYGTTKDGQQYYKIKNSWGTTWGEQGYALLARNQGNMCAIGQITTIPVLKTV